MKSLVYYCFKNDEICIVFVAEDGNKLVYFDDFSIGLVDDKLLKKNCVYLGEL